jgi:hypothetical protein
MLENEVTNTRLFHKCAFNAKISLRFWPQEEDDDANDADDADEEDEAEKSGLEALVPTQ